MVRVKPEVELNFSVVVVKHQDKRLVAVLGLVPVCAEPVSSELGRHSVLELVQSVERVPNMGHLVVVISGVLEETNFVFNQTSFG